MKEPSLVYVRRAGPREAIELIVSDAGPPLKFILTLGQARNLMMDLMGFLGGSTMSLLPPEKTGNDSDGELRS